MPLQAVLSNNDENTELASKKDNKNAKIQIKTENYVFVNKDGKADKRIVTVGIADDSQQQILAGVEAGEAVIVGPYKILRHLEAGRPGQGRASQTGANHQQNMSTGDPLIRLEGIAKHYQMGGETIAALDGIDLQVARNDYVAFIGSSGSGKSTMMNILGCLDTPTKGKYFLNGRDVA
ncbi:ATP-binding cassette domain-containing protein [Massilia sp. B-10]|nr:ATP-binding cassette domain-containing protein [Massilia sp. B-10]